ncbi:50S ribosomal protein L32 [candidate division WOR-1 bacterium RIFCSPLOWO2_02_FULL_46_20]|uniref:Large ribosomal subunit protein bL32 n=2 Tax=Saganbacteria TaxID=1703751 RepID=A0A1F4RGM5_UNCSA|nr:MAG: 50S ribosomal protein L32 [candidate division WOR-1 bacterium RIFCSPHIGHO2_02_FULL_45_12]OGC07308.1 MAG: 50S ribosomal protein L32 [candidate division WOR-1 bacterium RIFCSPLOWO2_02_FULL_46_20]OGC08457.1 MAG: 50S ribosomal protein L32 [candidate division WOR-1 bacterium RIFCSPLOWO2_12_FULL_45_9]
MPQPKKRHSNVRQGKRRASNYRLKEKNLSKCPSCGTANLPHHACLSCGTYKGRTVIKIKDKKAKKEKG